MVPSENFFCFESDIDKVLHAQWYPELRDQIFSLEELIALFFQTPLPPQGDRLAALRALFPGERENTYAPILNTIDLLRSALILTLDDINYVFGELPKTPKNDTLRRQLVTYTQSPLAEDRAFRVAALKERLTSNQTEWERPVQFFASLQKSLFFEEIAKSFPRSGGRSSELFDWDGPRPSSPKGPHKTPLAFIGEPTDCLVRMVDKISHSAPRPTVISFGGSIPELVFLKSRLRSRRIPFADLYSIEIPTRLARLGAVEDPEACVLIVPFRHYRPPQGTLYLAYAGKAVYDIRLPELILSAEETESLRQKGIGVACAFDRITRTQLHLDSLCRGYRESTLLFSSLPQETFANTRRFSIAPPRKQTPLEASDTPIPFPRTHFSATALESFALCPSRFLFSNRFRFRLTAAKPEDKFAMTFGQVIHKVLEHLFQEPEPNLTDEKWLVAYFEKIVEAHFTEALSDKAHYALLKEHFRRTARKLPYLERAVCDLRGKGRPIAFEEKFRLPLNGQDVVGVIDRVDETENGELLVIDYKTGTVDFSPNHIEQGEHFQALVYWLAAEHHFQRKVLGVVFYDLKQGEVRRGIVRGDGLSTDAKKLLTRGHAIDEPRLQRILETGLERMKESMDRVDRGDWTVSPTASNCSFCDFPTFCRRGHGFR